MKLRVVVALLAEYGGGKKVQTDFRSNSPGELPGLARLGGGVGGWSVCSGCVWQRCDACSSTWRKCFHSQTALLGFTRSRAHLPCVPEAGVAAQA